MLQPRAVAESLPNSPLARQVAEHPLGQSYGTLLHSLLDGRADKPQQCSAVGITSVRRGGGATTVALNLAWRAASEGVNVLVVDLDTVARTSSRRLNGRKSNPGFFDFLQSRNDLDECLQETDDEHLHFLNSGSGNGVVSPDMARHVLGELTRRYDLVLFDLPPVLEPGPWQEFAPYLDAALLVLEAGREDRRQVLEAKRRSVEIGFEISGAIWNKQRIH